MTSLYVPEKSLGMFLLEVAGNIYLKLTILFNELGCKSFKESETLNFVIFIPNCTSDYVGTKVIIQ